MNSDLRPLALVTGASSGIGYELARQFLENSYDVIAVAENRRHLEESAQSLRTAGAGRVETVVVDLSTRDGVESLWRQVGGRQIDVLAANAGVGVWGSFVDTDLDAELSMIQLNTTSIVHLTKLALRQMVERDSGRILITSSVAGLMPGPREAVYASTKAFLRFFAAALDNELKDTNVVVTALMPGPTDTHFFERAGMENTRAGQGKKDDPAMVAREAFEALQKGKDHVVTGAMNKVQTGMAALAPDSAKAAMHGELTKPAENE